MTAYRERTGYLSADDLQAAQSLHKRAPYSICGISHGFFSLARMYGGMTYQGCRYTYFPAHDECVRDDVIKIVAKRRKTHEEQAPDVAWQQVLDLGLDGEGA
jgi:hypothetical protein